MADLLQVVTGYQICKLWGGIQKSKEFEHAVSHFSRLNLLEDMLRIFAESAPSLARSEKAASYASGEGPDF